MDVSRDVRSRPGGRELGRAVGPAVRGHPATVPVPEALPAVVVVVVVLVAEQDEVVQFGEPAVEPVPDVVCLALSGASAAAPDDTVPVADDQRLELRSRHGARGPSDVQRLLGAAVGGEQAHGGVARQPAEGVVGEQRPAGRERGRRLAVQQRGAVAQQVLVIYAGTKGWLDKYPLSSIARWEKGYLAFMDATHPEIGQAIASKGTLDDQLRADIDAALTEFKDQFEV